MHTYRREGRYYFQYVFPKVLKKRFKERAIRFSLLTYDRQYAKRRAQLHYLKCLELESKPFTTLDEAIKFVRDVGKLEAMKSLSELVGSSKDEALQTALKLLDSHSIPFYLEIDPAKAIYGRVTDALVSVVKPKDKTLVEMPYFTGQAKIALIDASSSPTLGNPYEPYVVAHLHQLKVKDVPAEIIALILAENARSTAPLAQATSKHPPLSLSEAFQEFANFKAPSIDEKTLDEYDAAIKLFIDVLGDLDISELDTTKYNKFITVLRQLPANRSKGNKKGKSIEQLLAMSLPPMASKTVEKYHERAATALSWIADTHKGRNIHISPQLPLDKKAGHKETTRMPFDAEHLKTIHESDAAIQYLAKEDEPYKLWIPVVGLFTGARLNELCQLMLKDIGIEDGIDYISVNEDHELQKVKNKGAKGNKKKSSIRKIPIHPTLKELGFLDYIEKQRKLLNNKPDEILFQGLTYAAKAGYTRKMTRFFNDQLLNHLGITAKNFTFHSYRHTVSEKLNLAVYRNELNTGIKDLYLGHETKDTSENAKSYLNGKKSSWLIPALDHIKYDIDWTRYKALLDKFK